MTIFDKWTDLDPALKLKRIEEEHGSTIFDQNSVLDPHRLSTQIEDHLGVQIDPAAELDSRRFDMIVEASFVEGVTDFTFTDVTDANRSVIYASNYITVAGLGEGIEAIMSISGGEWNISGTGAEWHSHSIAVIDGKQVRVRGLSSSEFETAVNVTLTIGDQSDVFTITTRGEEGGDTGMLALWDFKNDQYNVDGEDLVEADLPDYFGEDDYYPAEPLIITPDVGATGGSPLYAGWLLEQIQAGCAIVFQLNGATDMSLIIEHQDGHNFNYTGSLNIGTNSATITGHAFTSAIQLNAVDEVQRIAIQGGTTLLISTNGSATESASFADWAHFAHIYFDFSGNLERIELHPEQDGSLSALSEVPA